MDVSTGPGRGRATRRPGRWRRSRSSAGSLAAAAVAIALMGSACGGDSEPTKDVAAADPSAVASAEKGGGDLSPEKVRQAALAYSKCMRENGVLKFPDPGSNGGISIDGSVVDQNSPQFKAANDECKGLLPAPPPGGVPENREQALAYSKCMRENGVPKFPDPNAGGGISISSEKLGVDPNSPVFRKADEKCGELLGGERITNGSGPQAPPGG